MKALIGALRVTLGLDSAAFESGAAKAETRAAGLRKKMVSVGSGLQTAGKRMSIGMTLPIVAMAKQAMEAQKVQERAEAAVKASLASMGDAAGFNLEQLKKMASEMQAGSLYGDEDILQKVTANLLTFGNISGDVFTRSSQLALDLSARLGTDLQGSAVMLGKALNDPVAGLSALSRVGVSFTEQQKEQIKAMVAAGDAAGAQALMLDELEKQYAGQAQALASTDSGKIAQATMAIGDAFEKIGAIVLPIVAEMALKVKAWAERFQELSPSVQTMIVKGAALAAAIGPVVAILGGILTAAAPLAGVIAALASPFGLVAIAVGAAAVLIYKHWDEIKAFVVKGVEVMGQALDRLVSFYKTLPDKVIVAIGTLGVKIVEFLGSISGLIMEKATSIGADIVSGLKEGVSGKWNGFKGWFGGLMGGVEDEARDVMDTHSPSRVFKRIGGDIMDGLRLGISDGEGGVVGTLSGAMERLGLSTDETFGKMGAWLGKMISGAITLKETLANALSKAADAQRQSAITGIGDAIGGGWGAALTGFAGSLMGFKDGGSFQVGGSGGIDSQLVALPDERVTVTRPDQSVASNSGTQEIRVIGGDLTLTDGGQIMARVQVLAGQSVDQAVSVVSSKMRSTKSFGQPA
jgi:hypothetical protein